MNEELLRIIYTEGIILEARIELEAMLATNKEREHRGETLAYGEDAIRSLIDKFSIHHNGLLTNLYGR